MKNSGTYDYVGPRKLTPNQYKNFRRHGVIDNDNKDISVARHGMRAEELTQARANQLSSSTESKTCSPNKD